MQKITNIQHNVFKWFLDFTQEITGMIVPDTNYRTMERAIEKRCVEWGLEHPEYLTLLHKDKNECSRFLNLITINETYFFREEKHYHLLREHVLPELYQRKKAVTLWSPSCSTGEEPYSLAMVCKEFQEKHPDFQFTVYASDINTDVLNTLKSAQYNRNSIRKDGSNFKNLFENRYLFSDKEGEYRVLPEIQQHVQVFPLNIRTETLSEVFSEDMDILFFRNTLLYMAGSVRPVIIEKLTSILAEGGYFFLASSEVPFVEHSQLDLAEVKGSYFLRKTSTDTAKAQTGKKSQQSPPSDSSKKPPALHVFGKSISKEEKRVSSNTTLKGKFDINKVIETANTITRGNSPETDPDNINTRAAQFYVNAVNAINKTELKKADIVLDEAMREFPPNKVMYHLIGFMHYLKEEQEEARRNFRMSLRYDDTFWPAYYYLGSLYRNKDKAKASEAFKNCRMSMLKSSNSREQSYSFLLEGFDENYFYEISKKWITKLNNP